jgi:hypothetical protein
MTARVFGFIAGFALLAVVGGIVAATSADAQALRSCHSEPTSAILPTVVAVTATGKLYHNPECTFIHGPLRTESGEQAIAEGYTPCTRCMKR